ncbi:MAG TPA: SRPBCC domain-containing protein [Kribbellaceae bacterium]|jgi:uncharacterized protein YndB with AHSA1/START domain
MTVTTTDTTVTMERTLQAPAQKVYDAWTQPELMAQWYCPNPAWELKAESDLRVGGAYVLTMGPHVVRGSYTELDEPRVIAFTWKWDAFEYPPSHVRVELTDTDGGTRLLLSHTELQDPDDVKNHLEGWEGCLNRLPAVLA